MAYWFHRNRAKTSDPVSFEVPKTTNSGGSAKLLPLGNELSKYRDKLLRAFEEPALETATIETSFNEYLPLLHGLLHSVGVETGNSDSKLRKLVEFKWTSSISKGASMAQFDSYFELASVCLEYAMWFMRHASYLAEKPNITEDQAKEVYMSLKTAAGVFHYVKASIFSNLKDLRDVKKTDINIHVIEAYKMQCIAEAQEVTLVRAVNRGHTALIISSLASETSVIYSQAADVLKSMDAKKVKKWRKYLEIKRDVHQSYGHCYNGDILFKKEEYGASIKALRESEKLYNAALEKVRKYSKRKAPTEHLFFKTLEKEIKIKLEKSTRENDVYHEKIPDEVPKLKEEAESGSVTLQEFALPKTPDVRWTKDLYDSFNVEDISNM